MNATLLRLPGGLALRAPGLLGPEIALVAVADRLFWNHAVGLSVPLFCVGVALLAARLRPGRRAGARGGIRMLFLVAALAPAVERLTALSVAFAVLGTLLSLRLGDPRSGAGWLRGPALAMHDVVAGPGQLVRDVVRWRRLRQKRSASRAEGLSWWLAWIAPLGLVAVFVALLADANPLIAGWIAELPIPSWADVLPTPPRALFWLALLVKLWPLIRARRLGSRALPRRPPARRSGARALSRALALLLTPAAVLRALVMLDLVLALQIGLDGAYLWGGLTLPDGLGYAAYAHRGAYPLVATALVAGGVALAIRRPGAAEPSGLAAALLLLFLGENEILVASAVRRLALYVSVYALTEWRVAAFAWMGLVALGLALVAVGGALRRDTRWLLRANLLAALAVLYGWCFLDVPRLVADYDVANCAELKGDGPSFDLDAVAALGPDAIPALDRFLLGFRSEGQRAAVVARRDRLARDVRAAMTEWRSWSLAGWRLARYLDTSGVAEPATSPAGDDGS